jgi:hypothetical protein
MIGDKWRNHLAKRQIEGFTPKTPPLDTQALWEAQEAVRLAKYQLRQAERRLHAIQQPYKRALKAAAKRAELLAFHDELNRRQGDTNPKR